VPPPNPTADQIDERIVAFEDHPTSKLFISGYGAATYSNRQNEDATFGALFVPIFHYKLSDRLHLTGEVEFDLRGEDAEVEVEYAQIDFLVNDFLTVTAGKFLLPFNTFSERFHPSWINKFSSLPPIYGAHGGGGGIVPILSDTGLQLRGGWRLPFSFDERGSRVNYAFYVTNGPRIEPESEFAETFETLSDFLEEEGAIMEAHELLEALDFEHHEGTEIEFGETFRDNNNNKTLGGRVGFLPIPSLEVGGSMMAGRFDDSSDLDFRMYGADLAYQLGALDLRGEYLRLDFDEEGGGSETIDGFYAEAGLRPGRLLPRLGMPSEPWIDRTELVLRYGEVNNGTHSRETAIGIVYRILPSVPLKLAYTIRDGGRGDDELQLQLAFGF
jgi:hypothetical protein